MLGVSAMPNGMLRPMTDLRPNYGQISMWAMMRMTECTLFSPIFCDRLIASWYETALAKDPTEKHALWPERYRGTYYPL